MKYYYQILCCFVILLSPHAMQAQADNDIFKVVKSSYGQSFILCQTSATAISTTIYFRMGPIYEFDSASGISLLISRIIDSHINSQLKSGGKSVKYYSTVDPEQIAFHFESDIADLPYVLSLSADKITKPVFDEEGLNEAKSEMSADIDSIKSIPADNTNTRIMKLLWTGDYKKLNIYGDRKTYKAISVDAVKAFHLKYFLPANSAVSVIGNLSDKEVINDIQTAFKDFKTKEFNPELITRVIDFKPLISTVQILAPSDKNLATVTYQNPGARQDREATYSAYILSQLINEKEGRVQIALMAAGLKNIKAEYICHNFYGTMEISAEPASGNYMDAFKALNELVNYICQKDYFTKDEIAKAQNSLIKEYDNLKANSPKDYMTLVTRYRFSNDENYFTSMADSINAVNVSKMRRYVSDYFANFSGIRCLYTTDTNMRGVSPDQQYFALDPSIEDIKFSYELNKTDIESDQSRQDLQRLIQWLRTNPDVHVQINGFSDEGEYVKAYDDTIKRFIDSTETFHKAMPDAYKKGYLRIEFMRAMKIAKAIYEAGITEDRITGTSMVFTSDTPEAAAANRKCTVTLEKIQPRPSLYEYHFGKKKEQDQSALPHQ